MFKALAVHLSLLIICLGLGGCFGPNPHAPLQYRIQTEKLKNGPPIPATADPRTSSVLRIDPVKIEPERSESFADLPTSVTRIYDRPPVRLSLADVVLMDLANNRNIKIQGYSMRIVEYGVPVAKGIYDLLLNGNYRYARTERQSGQEPPFGVSRGRNQAEQFALSQLIPTGGTVSATYNASRAQSGSTSNNTAFELNQPLLQGLGPAVTNAGIRIAYLASQGSEAAYRSNLEDQLQIALNAYWDLIGAIQALKVDQISYAAAQDLNRVNQVKFDVGMLAIADLLQTQAAADARYDQIVEDRSVVRDLEDQLKKLIFVDHKAPEWDVQLAPTQPIAWREMQVDMPAAVELALRIRPEMEQARANVAQARERELVARNNVLPTLDFIGALIPNGVGPYWSQAFANQGKAGATSYNVGLQISYPLQNRSARYGYKQATARVGQTLEQLKDTRDQVTEEVRNAARAYTSAREQIDVSQSQIESQTANLEVETMRLRVGLSTTFRVLQFQQDLASAQLSHIQAVIDTNKAAIALERAQGTLLETYGATAVQGEEAANGTAKRVRVSRRFPFIGYW